mmetsp:Transcript_27621/g.82814  ORF Transcript_27621/g.82814 Transcript_27621/m.82814 type:complete len:288 (-) Transcript_27621:926-1789(-)
MMRCLVEAMDARPSARLRRSRRPASQQRGANTTASSKLAKVGPASPKSMSSPSTSAGKDSSPVTKFASDPTSTCPSAPVPLSPSPLGARPNIALAAAMANSPIVSLLVGGAKASAVPSARTSSRPAVVSMDREAWPLRRDEGRDAKSFASRAATAKAEGGSTSNKKNSACSRARTNSSCSGDARTSPASSGIRTSANSDASRVKGSLSRTSSRTACGGDGGNEGVTTGNEGRDHSLQPSRLVGRTRKRQPGGGQRSDFRWSERPSLASSANERSGSASQFPCHSSAG